MSNYSCGRAFEYLAMRELGAKGYIAARTAGSHGLFDVIGIDCDSILLVQVKKGKRSYKKEQQAFAALPAPAVVVKQFWIRHRGRWIKTTV